MYRQTISILTADDAAKKKVADRLGKWLLVFSALYFGIHLVVAGVRHAF